MSSEGFILIALACWGFWGIFEKKALSFASSKEVLVTLYLLNSIQIPIIACILNATKPHWHLTSESLFWSGLASLTYAVAMLAYLRALSKSEASYVLGTTACYPVISLLLATPFLGEQFSLLRFCGSMIVAFGIFAIGLPNGKKQAMTPLSKEVKVCVFIAAFAWGLWGVIDKKAVSIADPLEITLGRYLWDAIILIFIIQMFRRNGDKIDLRKSGMWKFCTLSAICLAFGGFSYLSAMKLLPASYVISITSCYPVIMYVLAVSFLNERFSAARFAGIGLVVLGGMLVHFTHTLG